MIIVASLLALVVIVVLVMKMPGRSFVGHAPPLDVAQNALREALKRDVAQLAERNVLNEKAYAEAADFIEHSMREAGYATERQTFLAEGVVCANIVAERRGTSGEIVVIGAHYDT